MTQSEYRKHNEEYFKGKQAITLREIRNGAGEYIYKNEIVTINRKYRGFQIMNAGRITISRVDPASIELYEEK